MAKNKSVSINKSSIISIILIAIATLLLVFCAVGRYSNGAFKAICNFFLGTFGISIYGILIGVIVGATLYLFGKRIVIPFKYSISLVSLFVLVVLIVHMFSTTFLSGFSFSEYVQYCYNFYDKVPTFGGVLFGSIVYVLVASTTIYGASIILLALLALDLWFVVNFLYAVATHKLILDGEIPSKKSKEKQKKYKPSDILPTQETMYEQEYSPTYTQADIDEINNIMHRPLVQEVDDLPQTEEARAKAHDILFKNMKAQQQNQYDYAQQSGLSSYDPNKPFGNIDNDSWNNESKSSADPEQSRRNAIEQLFGNNNSSSKSSSSSSKSSSDNETHKSYEQYKRVDVTADGQVLPAINLYDEDNDVFSSNTKQTQTSSLSDIDTVDLFVEDSKPKSPFVENIITEDNIETEKKSDNSKVADLKNDPIISEIPENYYYNPLSEEESNLPSRDQQSENIYFTPKTETTSKVGSNENTGSVLDNFSGYQATDFEDSKVLSKSSASDSFIQDNSQSDIPEMLSEQPDKSSSKSVANKAEQQNNEKSKVHKYAKYVQPPMELLTEQQANQDVDQGYRQIQAEAIVKKLAVFGIKTESLEPVVGASVTQFRLRVLSDRTRMSDFKTYADDLKSCLEARDDIRIEAPIPGSNLVGIEVANRKKTPVMLRSILQSKEFTSAKGDLVFALGQNITGHNMVADLADMPHLLVAGTTGSGKSVVLNCMIVSLVYKYSPEYLRFIMVDPKFVELSRYNGLPHMLTSEAITATSDALASLDYLINEMEARYQLFRDARVGNIKEYNSTVDGKTVQKMPYIVLIVDELSDLMSTNKKSLEAKIIRLTQKARAAGIHLVLATQRPSVDVITGLIKANLPSRIALKVGSSQDSRTILDYGGAEKLLGKGDMLFVSSDSPTQQRIQGAYVSNNEIRQIVQFASSQNEAYYPEEVYASIFVSQQPQEEEQVDIQENKSQLDPLCKKALYIWITKNNGKASIASAQRALPIGFNRAGKIFDSLVALGCIEDLPANESNSKPRRVLVTLEDLDRLFPDQSID